MNARCLTQEEIDRGWYALECGCHGHVITTKVALKIPLDAIEYCPILGLPGVVKIDVLENLTK